MLAQNRETLGKEDTPHSAGQRPARAQGRGFVAAVKSDDGDWWGDLKQVTMRMLKRFLQNPMEEFIECVRVVRYRHRERGGDAVPPGGRATEARSGQSSHMPEVELNGLLNFL